MEFKKKFLFSVATLLFTIISSLALFEGALRFFDLGTRDVFTANEKEFHTITGIYAPNQSFTSKQIPALPYKVNINSLGYRGEELDLQKPKDEFRILMTGDSFTYGDFVNDHETLPAQLETFLQEECPKTRVINAGLRGGTVTGQSALINRGLALNPDLVLLTFYENDIKDIANPQWPKLEKNRLTKSHFPLSAIYPIMKYTYTWGFLLKARQTLLIKKAIKQNQELSITHKNNKQKKLEDKYFNELTSLTKQLEENDTPFIFVVYPNHKTISSGKYSLDSILDRVIKTNIDVINLTPSILSAPENKKAYLLPHDGHASPYGYKIAATHLSQALLSTGKYTNYRNHTPCNSLMNSKTSHGE